MRRSAPPIFVSEAGGESILLPGPSSGAGSSRCSGWSPWPCSPSPGSRKAGSRTPDETRYNLNGVYFDRAQKATDISGLEQRVGAVMAAVAALHPTDLGPVIERVAALEQRLEPVDLGPVQQRFDELEAAVRAIKGTDVSGLEQRLGTVSVALAGLQPTDLGAVNGRLDRIEALLAQRPAQPPPAPRREPGAKLLSGPLHGTPDDLKVIKGIAEKLEKLLHRLGVYYFWQMAEWEQDDVRHVDARLEVFKGRIDRDRWVAQARQLAKLPTSARPPAAEASPG